MSYLTKRQKEILTFVDNFIIRHDYAPSYREIANSFDYKSTATVAEFIEILTQKGYLKKDPSMARSLQLMPIVDQNTQEVALLGTIAAGQPIEAIRTSETVYVPKDMVKKGVFALRVRGDSMIEEGIFDGDYVIIEPTNTAKNGEIVVALIDNDKATLKRYYLKKKWISLEPANGKMKPIRTKKALIQGKVRGVIRKFH